MGKTNGVYKEYKVGIRPISLMNIDVKHSTKY